MVGFNFEDWDDQEDNLDHQIQWLRLIGGTMEYDPEDQDSQEAYADHHQIDWAYCVTRQHPLYIGDTEGAVYCSVCRVLYWQKGDYVRGSRVRELD